MNEGERIGMSSYAEFLRDKEQMCPDSGFEPLWMPDFLLRLHLSEDHAKKD